MVDEVTIKSKNGKKQSPDKVLKNVGIFQINFGHMRTMRSLQN